MHVYRSPMEKLLKQMDDNEVITNPKEPFRSFLNKLIYRCLYHAEKVNQAARHILHRHPKA